MKKKALCLVLIGLFLIPINGKCILSDPEIVDEKNDVFGPLAILPLSFAHIDIISAWFYEDPNEPDYLFTAIKIRNLEYSSLLRAIYSIHWTYNGAQYVAAFHTQFSGNFEQQFAGKYYGGLEPCECSFDLETDTITWKISKSIIGNPKPGDVLTNTFAWTALRFYSSALGELAKDYAPDGALYGKDYIIKY